MHHSRGTLIVGALGLASAVACSGTGPLDGASMVSSPIQGGTNDTTHTFAVGITVSQGSASGEIALCSGALLAPNLVATARHCVASLPSDTVTCPTTTFGAVTTPGNVVVTTDADIRTRTTRFGVSEIIVPSGADQTAVCGNDLALLILSQNVTLPEYVTPVLNPPMSDHTLYTPTVTAIGYGESTATDKTGTTAGTRRIRQNLALSCIPNDTAFPNCLRAEGGQMTAAEFASGNGTCEGDSGSSAYDEGNFDKGNWVSFGVLSRGGSMGSTCVGGIYTRFDAWSSLIIDTAIQAAMMGGYVLPPWASADGGTVVAGGSGSGAASSGDAGSTSRLDGGSSASREAGAAGRADGGSSSGGSGGSSGSAGSSNSSSGGGSSTGSSSSGSSMSLGAGAKDAGSVPSEADASRFESDSGAATEPESTGSGGKACTCEAVGRRPSGATAWPAALAGLVALFAQRRRRGGSKSRR